MYLDLIIKKKEEVIKKLLTKNVLRISNITEFARIEGPMSFTYSSKGFFGYLGKTMNGATSYSTSLRDTILIRTSNNKNILISPKDIAGFEEELEKSLLSSYLYV